MNLITRPPQHACVRACAVAYTAIHIAGTLVAVGWCGIDQHGAGGGGEVIRLCA